LILYNGSSAEEDQETNQLWKLWKRHNENIYKDANDESFGYEIWKRMFREKTKCQLLIPDNITESKLLALESISNCVNWKNKSWVIPVKTKFLWFLLCF